MVKQIERNEILLDGNLHIEEFYSLPVLRVLRDSSPDQMHLEQSPHKKKPHLKVKLNNFIHICL